MHRLIEHEGGLLSVKSVTTPEMDNYASRHMCLRLTKSKIDGTIRN